MSSLAADLMEAALAKGVSAEELVEAAQALRTGRSPSELAPTTKPRKASVQPNEAGVRLPDSPLAATAEVARMHGIERYDDLGLLGRGAMGEVRRVRDRKLGRTLAMKTIHAAALPRKDLLARFLEEAQATAQLQHPGIIPVYDLGILPDGRLWFTMKEITGTTYSRVVSDVHRASRTTWETTASGWSLRRLIDALRQICEAMGYAHSRGVVHRDLKPSNIMVGQHGEVMVLDWGLAKLVGRNAPPAVEPDFAPEYESVASNRSAERAFQTRIGQVAGTPAYMPPEQARGQIDQISPRSDVYALGAILYAVLSGRPPFSGNSANAILQQVKSSAPEPLGTASIPAETFGFDLPMRSPETNRPPIPPPLVEICERAMARQADERFESAQEMAHALQEWLDGAKRRDAARAIVAAAKRKAPEAEQLRAQAASLREESARLMVDVKPWSSAKAKLPGWKKEDEAIELERQAEIAMLEEELLLHGSLTHHADLPAAHAALARRYRAEHAKAEAAKADVLRSETLLRRHVAALPEDHADRLHHHAYLKGNGALTLVTDPPGAEVMLHRYVVRNRRLVAHFERNLGRTPLHEVPLPMGSYLCVLRHPGHKDVRYPVSIKRQEHWHGIPPGADAPATIHLPPVGALAPDDCYMPAGWFECGGDPMLDNSLPDRRVWVDARVFRRFPVTNQEFLAYLNALVASGNEEEALRNAPRERETTVHEQGRMLYHFDGKSFSLHAEAESELNHPSAPVTMVSWQDARAYAQWEAARTGQPWRLPGELEWEKASRGVDGRFYPWGSSFDPSWTSCRDSVFGPPKSLPVGQFRGDESVYGIRDLAGGVTDWCADPYRLEGPPIETATTLHPTSVPFAPEHFLERVVRGASWFYSNKTRLRSTIRAGLAVTDRHRDVGFRLARPYESD